MHIFAAKIIRKQNLGLYFKGLSKPVAVCCGVRGRALAVHTDVRGFEPQFGG